MIGIVKKSPIVLFVHFHDKMYIKVLTDYETEILDKYIAQNYDEFHQCTFNHALGNTLPSWRAESLATDEAFVDYVAKIQQTKI